MRMSGVPSHSLEKYVKKLLSLQQIFSWARNKCYTLSHWDIRIYSFLHDSLKVKVAQSCLTLCNPIYCSPPGSSVLRILHAKILVWVAILQGIFLTQGSNPGLLHSRFLTIWATREPQNTLTYPNIVSILESWSEFNQKLLIFHCLNMLPDKTKSMDTFGFFFPAKCFSTC